MSHSNPEGATIWIVDDDPSLLESLQAVLDVDGWKIRPFQSPRKALEAASLGSPDLAIIDLMMPEMSGLELIRELRQHPTFDGIPVMVLTAMSDEENLRTSFQLGADDVLRKPYSVVELRERARALLRTRQYVLGLSQANREANFLSDLSTALNSTLNSAEVLALLVRRAADVLAVDRCSIVLVEHAEGEAADSARLIAASDDDTLSDLTLNLSVYPELVHVMSTRKPLIIDSVAQSPVLAEVLSSVALAGIKSMALFPMIFGDDVIGVLFLRNLTTTGPFGRGAHDLAAATANVAAVAIRNASMFEELEAERARLDDALRQLQETKDFLANLIDSSMEPIVACDTKGRIILFNKAAEYTLGYVSKSIMSRDVRMLYPSGGAENMMKLLRSEDHGGQGRLRLYETNLVASDGSVVPVSISAAVVEKDGTETATVGIFADLRERIRMSRELAEANESLERTRRQRVMAELAGAAAHELNQPLTSVLGYAELLSMKLDDNDSTHVMLDKLVAQVVRMSEIVRRIGDITSYKTKTYVGNTRIVDLSDNAIPVREQDAEPPVSDEPEAV